MKPPKTSGDEQQITALIEESAGSSYILKYPENGSNRSAIVMRDLDGDAKDEAVAFCQTAPRDETLTYMLIMHKTEDGWALAGSYKTKNANIDRIEFSDITGDGNLEVICGFKTFNANVNQLTVSAYSDGTSSQLDVSQTYTSFVLNDFNGDGKSDILSLSIQTDKNSEAVLLSYNAQQGKIQSLSSVRLDQNVTSFEHIISGMLNSQIVGAAVDGIVSTDKLCTQIIYYDKATGALVNGLYNPNEPTPNPTIRDGKTYCCDIENDNIIEIPTLSKMPYSTDENAEFVATAAVWNEFDSASGTLAENSYMIVNYNHGYYFQLTKELLESTTARINPDDSSMTVYHWENGGLGSALLTIKTMGADEWAKTGKSLGYSLIREEGTMAYCYKLETAEDYYNPTDEEIKQSFKLFSDYTED